METAVLVAGAMLCFLGAFGVVTRENPVHAALSLVGTLLGIAVLFLALEAEFLAAAQIVVYAGSIVVLILFVIMLIGVDTSEDLQVEPIVGQRVGAAIAAGVLAVGLTAVVLLGSVTGEPSATAPASGDYDNVTEIGRVLFTDHLLAFEITSVLLVIAVVGAVVLARHRTGDLVDDDLPGDEIPAGADGPADDVEVTR